jgi:hypothetical protein
MDPPDGDAETTGATEANDATGTAAATGGGTRPPDRPPDRPPAGVPQLRLVAAPEPEPAGDDRAASGASPGRRMEVSGTQVCASTLASVSGAAVASVFGVAGTVVGAAVVSVIATVAGALYTHGLQQTGEKLQQHPVVRQWWQPRRSMAAPLSGTDDNSATATATAKAPGPGGRSTWRERLSDRRWGVAVATGGVFALSLLLITAVELVGQRPISGSHDRDTTSIGSLLGGSGSTDEAPADDPSTGDDPSAPDATAGDGGSADDGDGTGGDSPATTDGSGSEEPPDPDEPPDGTSPPTSDPTSPPTSASSSDGSA